MLTDRLILRKLIIIKSQNLKRRLLVLFYNINSTFNPKKDSEKPN